MTSAGFLIREPREGDLTSIADLMTQLGYPATPQQVGERLRQLETSSMRGYRFMAVAEQENRIVGCVEAEHRLLLFAEPWAEIMSLVVDATARRSGAGRVLVAAVETWAVGRGLRRITVRSNVVRPESHSFYRRVGYENYKTQHVYRKNL